MGQAIGVNFGDGAAVGLVEQIAGYTGYKCVLPLTCRAFRAVWSRAQVADPGILIYGSKAYLLNLRKREYTEFKYDTFAVPPHAAQGCARAFSNGCLYLLGGKDDNGSVLSSVHVLNVEHHDMEHSGSDADSALSRHSCGVWRITLCLRGTRCKR